MINLAQKNFVNISYKGFENINTEKLLIILNEIYNDKISLFMELKIYLDSRWYDKYEYCFKQSLNNKWIAFYSDFYYRKDKLTTFHHFIKEFPEFDYVIPVKLAVQHGNLWRSLKMLKYDICNMWRIRNVKEPLKKKVFLIRVLGLVKLYTEKMQKYLKTKTYSYGLVYSDTTPDEHVLVQIMKQNGIRTATLQHGIFDKRGYWKGLEFRGSVADDWLAWNLYSKELAMECGIVEKKIRVLGIPRYIIPVQIEEKKATGTFSVILGGPGLEEENRKLIKYANLLSEENNIKYFIRCHPDSNIYEYYRLTNKKFCIRQNRQQSITRMCEQSDFSLIGSGTSMVIDLIYLKQPFLQLYEKWNGKQYWGRKNYFRGYEELREQFKEGLKAQNDEVFCYYCTTTDVKNSYANYFNALNNSSI